MFASIQRAQFDKNIECRSLDGGGVKSIIHPESKIQLAKGGRHVDL